MILYIRVNVAISEKDRFFITTVLCMNRAIYTPVTSPINVRGVSQTPLRRTRNQN
jgi:hypothetical protein